jgi:transposase
VKQLLDVEARLAVGRCRRSGRSLVVESPKTVGRLGQRRLTGWAAGYFANRCQQLAEEMSVWYWEVNPAHTCSQCGWRDKRSRKSQCFRCVACGYSGHADLNAARNIAEKGTSSLARWLGDQEA